MSLSRRFKCCLCGRNYERDFCPHCSSGQQFEQSRQDPKMMTPAARAEEVALLVNCQDIPFNRIQERLTALLGRPVYDYELYGDNQGRLVAEAVSGPPPPRRPGRAA